MVEATDALKARPVAGGVLGLVLGLAVAVLLQQHGIWPLDQVLVFLIPAIFGIGGLLLTSLGRTSAPGAMTTMLVILVALGAWGAIGLGAVGERGQLNGGCMVSASTPIDSTVVTDTTRTNPFSIEADGALDWVASSPTVFRDYEWRIWVDLGGFPITIESDSEENADGATTNSGATENVSEYGAERGIPVDELRGVFIVGGEAATCDGFAFVEVVSGFLETTAAKIAVAVVLLALAALIVLALQGRGAGSADMVPETTGEPKSPF